jgi:hypothetical protein
VHYPNTWRTLGLQDKAYTDPKETRAMVKTAFRKQGLCWHPDKSIARLGVPDETANQIWFRFRAANYAALEYVQLLVDASEMGIEFTVPPVERGEILQAAWHERASSLSTIATSNFGPWISPQLQLQRMNCTYAFRENGFKVTSGGCGGWDRLDLMHKNKVDILKLTDMEKAIFADDLPSSTISSYLPFRRRLLRLWAGVRDLFFDAVLLVSAGGEVMMVFLMTLTSPCIRWYLFLRRTLTREALSTSRREQA